MSRQMNAPGEHGVAGRTAETSGAAGVIGGPQPAQRNGQATVQQRPVSQR